MSPARGTPAPPPPVRWQARAGVVVITLDRPEVRNAVDRAAALALQRAVEDCSGDAIRAVVLTGADGTFCSGQDLRAAAAEGAAASAGDVVRATWNPVVLGLRRLPKPVVAAVGGAAVGAGLGLALACDVRVAADDAVFSAGFARVGLMPDSGTSWLLPRAVGDGRARDLVLTARTVDAAEALAIGLVDRLVPAARLFDEALALAGTLAAGPTAAYAAAKQALDRSPCLTLEEALEVEADLQAAVGRTADAAEGVRAFAEKRLPVFRGR